MYLISFNDQAMNVRKQFNAVCEFNKSLNKHYTSFCCTVYAVKFCFSLPQTIWFVRKKIHQIFDKLVWIHWMVGDMADHAIFNAFFF